VETNKETKVMKTEMKKLDINKQYVYLLSSHRRGISSSRLKECFEVTVPISNQRFETNPRMLKII